MEVSWDKPTPVQTHLKPIFVCLSYLALYITLFRKNNRVFILLSFASINLYEDFWQHRCVGYNNSIFQTLSQHKHFG